MPGGLRREGHPSHFLAAQQPREAGLLLLGRKLLATPLRLVLPLLLGFREMTLVPMLADVPFAALSAALLRRERRALSRAVGGEGAPGVAAARVP
jgi:hypothetical protein